MIDPTTPGGAVATEVIQALPPDIQALITQPGKTSERIKAAIRWAARPDASVVRRHQRRNAAIATFADIQNAKLHDMDVVGRQIARTFRRRAALTGAATGLPGGLWAVVAAGADVQLTAIYAVRMVADIAQAYGYDTSALDEQAELADVLAVAAGIDGLRGVGTWLTRQELAHLIPEVLPKLLTRMSVRITEEQAGKWAGRIIPGLGAVIGGAIDYTFLRVAGRRALEHYHARYVREHGMDGRALPAPATAVLPAAGVAEAQTDGAQAEGGEVGAAAPSAVPASLGAIAATSPAPISMPVEAPEALPQRSGVLAGLLEFIIPGAGAFYAGRFVTGLVWFIVSAVALIVVGPALAGPIGALGQGNIPTNAPDWAPYVAVVAALWLVARIAFAVRYARRYASLHFNRPPEHHFAAQLATFAFLALLVTVGACAALGYLVYAVIAGVVH
jgi:hypothetical protein